MMLDHEAPAKQPSEQQWQQVRTGDMNDIRIEH
jgi:hypothetical protein